MSLILKVYLHLLITPIEVNEEKKNICIEIYKGVSSIFFFNMHESNYSQRFNCCLRTKKCRKNKVNDKKNIEYRSFIF